MAMSQREKAYRLVERDLRKHMIRDITLWREPWYRGGDGQQANVSMHTLGEAGVTASGYGMMAATDLIIERSKGKK